MHSTMIFVLSLILLSGCGKSEDEIRTLVRDEFSRSFSPTYIITGQPIGPYTPAVQLGKFMFVSGQIGLNPETVQLAGDDIESQTRQALTNIMNILKQAGFDSSHVVQCSVFLKDINDFQRMNLIYGGFFPEDRYPARTTVEVSNLPRKAKIEIAAIAYKP
ncbi:MAG TPA: Rid family detoxifying hydrolase [Bacteroidota bacterium]|nr:Rid family detoxifying hydrolase [Bacteroidota bacterium]